MITAETSSIPGFVAELVRAANEVDRLAAAKSRACCFVR